MRFVCWMGLVACSGNGAPTRMPPEPSTSPVTTLPSTPGSGVTVTYLGNAGVLLEDGQHTVLIDSLLSGRAGWVGLSAVEAEELDAGIGRYAEVDLVLTTHNHGDHFGVNQMESFFAAHPEVPYIAPAQAADRLAIAPGVPTLPAFGEEARYERDGLVVDVLGLRHFDQFGNDFSGVENYGYLVQMGGITLFHTGDVRYEAATFEPFDLPSRGVDVAFLPTFNTLLSMENATLIEELVAPTSVVALHLRAVQVEEEALMAEELFGAQAFTEPLEQLSF